MSRVPANIEAAYLAYLTADIPDARAAWVTFRESLSRQLSGHRRSGQSDCAREPSLFMTDILSTISRGKRPRHIFALIYGTDGVGK